VTDPLMPGAPASTPWRKSSFSASGDCVEVSFSLADGGARVRDSKNTAGPTLAFTRREWQAFLSGVRAGEFDR